MTVTNFTDKRAVRISSTQMVLEKTNRILGIPDIRVKVEDAYVDAPAFTDGKDITINSHFEPARSAMAQGISTHDMFLITAANFHEFAHCKYMPRLDTVLVKEIHQANAFLSFNILQDQADESRFVHRYEPAAAYFTGLVTYYMTGENDIRNNYPLVSGRLFLPSGLRDKLKDAYQRPKIIDDLDQLSAEYKTLLFPHDQQRMLEVVIEFHKLLTDQGATEPFVATPHSWIKNGDIDQDELEEVLGSMAAESEEDNDEGDDDQDQTSGTEASEEDDEEGEPSSGKESGTGGEEEPTQHEKEAEADKARKEAFDDALEEVESEVEDRIESIRDHEGDYLVNANSSTYDMRTPTAELLQTVERCREVFREAAERAAPGWHVNQRHGKLNPRRYAQALKGNEHVYRRWQEGVHDAMDFEVVFLLDTSSSMEGSSIYQASDSLWVLKRTFEEHDGIVTVLGFSNEMTLLSQRGATAQHNKVPSYTAYGGTTVSPAMLEARRILGVSRKPLRLNVIITDGYFADRAEAKDIMSQAEYPISVIGIETTVEEYAKQRGVVHAEVINSATELVPVVQKLALRLADERMKRRN